jgi:hypothetical protein
MRVAREEIFGPVAEAIARANDSTFGLGGGVWPRDVGKTHRLAREKSTVRQTLESQSGTVRPTLTCVLTRPSRLAPIAYLLQIVRRESLHLLSVRNPREYLQPKHHQVVEQA